MYIEECDENHKTEMMYPKKPASSFAYNPYMVLLIYASVIPSERFCTDKFVSFMCNNNGGVDS